MKKIVIAGGTGNLGKLLSLHFLKKGYEVVVFSRSLKKGNSTNLHYVLWDGEEMGDWVRQLEGAEALINLSGVSINRRFTKKNKELLRLSRINSTVILGNAMQTLANPPKVWVNASGVSLFQRLENIQDERSNLVGEGFLAELVQEWEAAFKQFVLMKTRKVVLRISPVLSAKFGMMEKLLPLTKWGLAGTVGTGKQIVSWIHEEDFVAMLDWIIHTDYEINICHATSPFPVTNEEFMRKLRNAAGSSIGLPLPSILAKVGSYLQGVDSGLLLDSVPVTTKLTTENGFSFKFPYIEQAFAQIINKSK